MACRSTLDFHTARNGSSQSSSVTSSRRPAATLAGSGSGRPALTCTKTPRVVATRSFSLASQKSLAKAQLVVPTRVQRGLTSTVSTELCSALWLQSKATPCFLRTNWLRRQSSAKPSTFSASTVVAPSDSVSVRAAQSHAALVSPQQSVERSTGFVLRRRAAARSADIASASCSSLDSLDALFSNRALTRAPRCRRAAARVQEIVRPWRREIIARRRRARAAAACKGCPRFGSLLAELARMLDEWSRGLQSNSKP